MTDFGFPNNFNRVVFNSEQRKKKTKAAIKSLVISVIYAVAVTYFVAFNFFPDALENSAQNKMPILITAAISLWLIYSYVKIRSDKVLESDEDLQRLKAYDSANATWEGKCNDWMERKLETGLTFWKDKRGIELENALMRLFKKRGCEVQTTKISGDGGVDLIVKIGDAEIWCQCKGHAKPISVAPIREIAGVCSRSTAHPAVFAVNGFTKPAQVAARELGVQLFDANHIVSLARRSDLINLSQDNGKHDGDV